MNPEKERQRARRKRALARKVGRAMDGLLYLQPFEDWRAANENRMKRVLAECFPEKWTAEQFYGTSVGALPETSISRLYAWITKRLRYRNRKAYATARKHGIPRDAVGQGLTLAFINGSTLFTRVTVRAPASLDVLSLSIEVPAEVPSGP